METPLRPLPAPIKPRKLKRAPDGYTYVTSDYRYTAVPAYSPTLQRGSASKPSYWVVTDRTAKGEVTKEYPTLTRIREALCAPHGHVPWLVCDMDEGVMHVATSRKAAVEWSTHYACAPVRSRNLYPGSDCYDYTFGTKDDDRPVCFFIMRADVAHLHGFDPLQQPRCPYPDDPYETVRRDDEIEEDN
ncbi:hypothetical protein [Streptomyces sp. NPDC018055]|uniref:hypothetical protein n=1 Tax=Streptomyces sp. NPDC018055 TaxID=3365038 RepID=UPI0037935180